MLYYYRQAAPYCFVELTNKGLAPYKTFSRAPQEMSIVRIQLTKIKK